MNLTLIKTFTSIVLMIVFMIMSFVVKDVIVENLLTALSLISAVFALKSSSTNQNLDEIFNY
jgi:hypothetical protein